MQHMIIENTQLIHKTSIQHTPNILHTLFSNLNILKSALTPVLCQNLSYHGNHDGFISKTLIIDVALIFSTVDSLASTSCKEEALKIVINRCCMVVHYHSQFFMLAACMSHPPSQLLCNTSITRPLHHVYLITLNFLCIVFCMLVKCVLAPLSSVTVYSSIMYIFCGGGGCCREYSEIYMVYLQHLNNMCFN